MANWKKVVVSGSSPEFSTLHVDNLSSGVVIGSGTTLSTRAINGSGDILATTGASGISASGSFSGSFAGDGSQLTGIPTTLLISGSTGTGSVDLKDEALSVLGTANEIETSVTDQTITIGLPDNVTVVETLTAGTGSIQNNLTVNGDTILQGNLTVNGTTTYINTQNLYVEDKFALFASGSTSAIDGGFIIQSDIDGSGYGFGYKASVDRWALEDGLSGITTAFSSTPTAYVGSVEYGLATNIPVSPSYGGSSAGYGNIWVSTDTSDIWIYA
jgi:hypothetical protein